MKEREIGVGTGRTHRVRDTKSHVNYRPGIGLPGFHANFRTANRR